MECPSQTETKPLILCPDCKVEMCLFGIEHERIGRDLFTFECRKCDRIEVRGVATFEAPHTWGSASDIKGKKPGAMARLADAAAYDCRGSGSDHPWAHRLNPRWS
jgi:hypothetical protein